MRHECCSGTTANESKGSGQLDVVPATINADEAQEGVSDDVGASAEMDSSISIT